MVVVLELMIVYDALKVLRNIQAYYSMTTNVKKRLT